MSTEMQTSELSENVIAFIDKQESHFIGLNQHCPNSLDFKVEAEFAKQILLKNDYILGIARTNPDSLYSAISNVASIGLSLSPALSYSYLVPRKINKQPAICLDISYRGLIKLVTDSGTVKAMKAELVYENDTFEYRGFHEKPTFEADPFRDRGELVGVYVMALMADSGYLVETMTIDEINDIRDSSEAYKAAKAKGGWSLENNVWVTFYTEMAKKTCIKRAYKTIPTSRATEVMGKAIEVLNTHEGIEFQEKEYEAQHTDEELTEYKRCIEENDSFNLFTLISSLCAEAQIDLKKICVPAAPQGMKGKVKEVWKKSLSDAEMEVTAAYALLLERLDDGDDSGALEILSECSAWTVNYFDDRMSPEHQIMMSQLPRDGEE